MSECIKISFWVLAVIISLFWGIRSVILFTTDAQERLPEGQKSLYFLRTKYPRISCFFIGSHQFVFNFIGSLAGWGFLYYLIKHLPTLEKVNFLHLLLFLLSIIGVTGHLPQFIQGIIVSPESIAKRLMKILGIEQ